MPDPATNTPDLAMPDDQWEALQKLSDRAWGTSYTVATAETPNQPPPPAARESSNADSQIAQDVSESRAVEAPPTEDLQIAVVDRGETEALNTESAPTVAEASLDTPSEPDDGTRQLDIPDSPTAAAESLDLPAAPTLAQDDLSIPLDVRSPEPEKLEEAAPPDTESPDLTMPETPPSGRQDLAIPLGQLPTFPGVSGDFPAPQDQTTAELPINPPPASALGILTQSQSPTAPGERSLPLGYVPLDAGGELFMHPAAAGMMPDGGANREDELAEGFENQLDNLRERLLERTAMMIEEHGVLAEMRETDW